MNDNRSYMARKETVEPKWYVVDATDMPLGRLASRVAVVLMGKHKPTYTPHVDTGDFVIIVNADKVAFTGNNKMQTKVYRHTGYPKGFRETTYAEMMRKDSTKLVERVIKGMLPKSRLHFDRKLKVYAGNDHPHAAQKPEVLDVRKAK